MKLLLVIALVLSVHEINALLECTQEYCARLRCAQAATCPPGTYKQSSGTCNCCSVCVEYQTEGQSCENQECLPDLTCNANNTCESTHKPQFCDAVRCAAAKDCPDGQVLMPRDPDKCRCCDACDDENEIETRDCVDGNYVD